MNAGVAELVDAVDSKSIVLTDVLVRFQSSVHNKRPTFLVGLLLCTLLSAVFKSKTSTKQNLESLIICVENFS